MNSSKNSIRSSKKKDYEILIRRVSRVQHPIHLKKNPGMVSIREEFFPRSDPQKKGSMGCTCLTHFTKDSNGNDSAKKTRGWIPSGRNFSPDRIPKKKEVWDVLA